MYGSKNKLATSAPTILTAPQLASMDSSARAAYFNQLPADQRASQQQTYQQYQNVLNKNYMKRTIRKISVAPQSSGGALSQIYSPGATLPFTIPSAQNAFCEGFIIRLNLSATLATGTSAVYAATASAPWGLIDNIIVQYNGVQSRFKPYIIRSLSMLQGDLNETWPNSVLAGQHNAGTDAYLSSGVLPVATGANTLTYEMYVPFNWIANSDARGLLPIMGGETVAQIIVTCAPQAIGPDPILNTWSSVSGTGQAVTFSGTSSVAIYAVYRDGTSFGSPALLGLDLSGLGTVQTQLDVPLTGITAGNIYRQKVSIMDTQLAYVINTVIDAQQSNKYSTVANISVIEIDKDSVGANVFLKYGTGTNLSVQEYFAQVRYQFGQDLDEGIVPLVYGPGYGIPSSSSNDGTAYLNTSTTGWTDFHYGYQLTAISGVAGITPRVETHVVFINSAGLISA